MSDLPQSPYTEEELDELLFTAASELEDEDTAKSLVFFVCTHSESETHMQKIVSKDGIDDPFMLRIPVLANELAKSDDEYVGFIASFNRGKVFTDDGFSFEADVIFGLAIDTTSRAIMRSHVDTPEANAGEWAIVPIENPPHELVLLWKCVIEAVRLKEVAEND